MNSLRDIYRRFKRNYRTDTGGINLYPQFDSDLEKLLYWLSYEDGLADTNIDDYVDSAGAIK
jgi:hypothetical protein